MLNSIGGFVPPFFIVVVDTVAISTKNYALLNFFIRLLIIAVLHPFVDALYLVFWVDVMEIKRRRMSLPTLDAT